MDPRKAAAATLATAETELRRLVSEAAAAGDYSAVMELAGWASAVADIASQAAPGPLATTPPLPTQTAAGATRAAGNGSGAKKSAASRVAAIGSEKSYPRFLRQGDQLVKVGWSRRLREEYRHKAPWRAVELVTRAVASAGRGGRMFAPEQFVPVKDPTDHCDVPVYQVYVTLAWLKDQRLVEAHGRSGYTVIAAKDLVDAARLSWAATTESGK